MWTHVVWNKDAQIYQAAYWSTSHDFSWLQNGQLNIVSRGSIFFFLGPGFLLDFRRPILYLYFWNQKHLNKQKKIRIRKKECIFTFLGTSQMRLFFGFYDFYDKFRTGFHKSYLHYWEEFHVSSEEKNTRPPKILLQHKKKYYKIKHIFIIMVK